MEYSREFETLFITILIAAAATGIAVFGFLAVMGYVHAKAKMIVHLYQEITRQVERQEKLKKTGGDAIFLPKYLQMQAQLRSMLLQQGLLRITEPKASTKGS